VQDVSERVRAEQEIRSLARFPGENPQPVLRATPDGTLLYVNAACAALLPEWQVTVGQALPPALREAVAAVLQKGAPQTLDIEYGDRVYSFFVVPVVDAGYANLYGRDITEQRKAVEALRESEERFRTTLYSIGDAVITTDTAGRVQVMNPLAEALTGWSEADARGKSIGEVFHIVNEKTRLAVADPTERVLREGVVVGLANHTLLVSRDGREFPIADSGAPIRNEQGEITGTVLVFRDQTEERATQEALRTSEANYHLLFKEMLGGFAVHEILCDQQGKPCDYRFLEVNPEFERLTGLAAAEITGKRVLEVLPNLEPGWIERYGEVALTGKPAQFEDYAGDLGKYFEVRAYSPRPGQFAVMFHDITERKQAEAALRAERDFAAQVMNTMGQGLTVTDDNGLFEYVNPAYARMVGRTPEELQGRTPEEFTFPDDLPVLEREHARRRSGESSTYETRLLHAGGHPVPVMITAVPRWRGKQIVGAIAVITDISERKQTEQALRESEARLTSIFKAAPIGIGLVSPDRRLLQVNSNLCEMVGYSAEELAGQSARILYPSDEEYERVGVEKYEQIRARGIGSVETLFQHKNGTTRSILLSSARLDPQDPNSTTAFTALDITERKRAEDALRESRAQYHQLFEMESDAIFLIANDNGQILQANTAASEMYGYSREELLSLKNTDLSAQPEQTQKVTRETPVIETQRVSVLDRLHRKKDGTVFPVEISGRFFEWGGRSVHIAAIRDVTGRKKVEEALRRLNEELEQRVARRTAELVAANAVKDEFVSNVSHELRTPLAGIKLHVDLLARHPAGSERYLQRMRREVTRLELLIEDLLSISRLDQDPMLFSAQTVDLARLAAGLVEDRQPLADQHSLKLTSGGLSPLVVEADPALIEQMISILLTNALNYTPAGGEVHVLVQACEREGQPWACLSVSDSGPGIAPEEQERVFERFFRGTAAQTSGRPGTGLGLAIAKEIVARHGGHIEVHSSGIVGEGTRFEAWLPLSEAQLDSP